MTTSTAPKQRLRIAMLIVAISLGLFGVFSVNASYKTVRVPAVKGTATREAPQGDCFVKLPFVMEGRTFSSGTLANWECREAFRKLTNPTRHLEATLAEEEIETVVTPSTLVEQRQWGSEIISRFVGFLVGALLGLALVVVGNAVFLNRSRLLSAASSGLQFTRAAASSGLQFTRAAATRVRVTTAQMTARSGNSPVTGSELTAPQQASPMAVPVAPKPKNNFDLQFNRFVTPTIVKIFYFLLSLLIFVGGIIIALGLAIDLGPDSGRSYFVGLLMSVPLALVGMAFSWLLVRLLCESAIVIFRMADDLRNIRNQQRP